MNHILIAGHLGADPEVRFTSGGQKVTTLRVACNSRRGGKDETTWYRVTIWGEQFDKMISYLKKGSPVMAAGELSKPEIYNDKEGKPQLSLNVVASNLMFSPFGRADKDGQSRAPQQEGQQSQQGFASQAAAPAAPASPFDQMVQGQGSTPSGLGGFGDEEIPF